MNNISKAKITKSILKFSLDNDVLEFALFVRNKYGKINVKLLKELIDTTHYKWRYILLTERYKKASLKNYKLRYGNVLGEEMFTKKSREGSVRCIEYWLKRGYSEVNARKEISKVCSTVSKSSYIARYGEDEGSRKFEEYRQLRASIGKELSSNGKIKTFSDTVWNFDYWLERSNGNEVDAHIAFEEFKSSLASSDRETIKLKYNYNDDEVDQYFRERSCRCTDFWIKRGCTEAEAILKVEKVQRRDLDYFTDKYGFFGGILALANKTTKFANSWNEKSEAELWEINRKRIKTCSLNNVRYCETAFENNTALKELDSVLYVIRHIEDNTLKIGITRYDINTRYRGRSNEFEKIIDVRLPLYESFRLEQDILLNFEDYSVAGNIFKSIELIDISQKDSVIQYIKDKIGSDIEIRYYL